MISLDKNILNKDSVVARRMVEYGKKDELFIIIPYQTKQAFDLSQTVHVQSTGGNKFVQFPRLIKIGSRLLKEHNIPEITTQDPFFTGLAGWYLSKKFKINLEVQIHGDFFGNYYKNQWLKLSLAKFIVKSANTVRVVGERVKQSVLYFGVDENKIIVRSVKNDPEQIKNYSPAINLHKQYPGYEKIFLVLGRIEPVKNITWLVDILKDVLKQKNYLLLIVGRGSEEASIKFQIQNNNLDNNVILQNWTENPYGYLKTVDCVLFPSLSEGYGLVPMEAQSVGTPVIMNDVGVANYELKPSENVEIVPVNDKEQWIQAILDI